MPIFCVKSVKIYTGQKNLHWRRQPRQRQLSGMNKLIYLVSVGWLQNAGSKHWYRHFPSIDDMNAMCCAIVVTISELQLSLIQIQTNHKIALWRETSGKQLILDTNHVNAIKIGVNWNANNTCLKCFRLFSSTEANYVKLSFFHSVVRFTVTTYILHLVLSLRLYHTKSALGSDKALCKVNFSIAR